jgi:MtN3 and saliva related transmembrane protein
MKLTVSMESAQWIGIIASICTGISLLPQLIKLIKEKKAENVSFAMMVVLLGGLVLWIIYGLLKKDYIIVTSNGVSILLNISILILGAIYRKAP